MRDFDHRQLDAYRLGLEFVTHAEQLAESLPLGRASLADQLRAASMSICLNTAEGAGEFRPAEKARFYRLARRSATECAAALDICRAIRVGDKPDLELGDDMLPLLRRALDEDDRVALIAAFPVSLPAHA
jgi:four helix bundle protein